MKAHSMRRTIWIVNIALGACVAAVVGWYLFDVKAAVAKVLDQNPRKPPQEMRVIVAEFDKDVKATKENVLKPPVEEPELKKVILRADYARKDPTHWIFSGPRPPQVDKGAPDTTNRPPPPKGLDSIGKIDFIINVPPDNALIAFKFKGDAKKQYQFLVGEFVKKKDQSGRFKVTKVEEPEKDLYKIHYAVYDDPKDVPIEKGEMLWDNRRKATSEGDVIHIVPTTSEDAAAAAKADAAAKAAAGTGDGTTDGAKDGGTDGTSAGTVNTGDGVVGSGSVVVSEDEVKVSDLKPKFTRNTATRKDIEFDDATYRFFRGKNAKSVMEKVKTNVAKDKSGKPYGVRIVDTGDLPADVLDLKPNDTLVSINGQPVRSRSDIVRIAESLPETTTRVTLVVDRYGRKVTFNIDPRDPKTRRRAGQHLNN